METANLVTSVVTAVLFLVLIFFFVITLAIRYRMRKRENEELIARQKEERMRIELEIQEETLKYVSRELHDNVSAIASIIKINLISIDSEDESVKEKVNDSAELMRQLMTDVKSLSKRLALNPLAENGLLAAIAKQVDMINKTGAFRVELESSGEVIYIEDNTSIILFRMVQEVLNNMVKHSNASIIRVTIDYTRNSINLALKDNGVGFDVAAQTSGAGLTNLKYRAELIGAEFSINSVIGQGTLIKINYTVK